MKGLSEAQLQRQDFVDNSIFALIESFVPGEQRLDWDIQMIGDVRDLIGYWLCDRKKVCDEMRFYPFLSH